MKLEKGHKNHLAVNLNCATTGGLEFRWRHENLCIMNVLLCQACDVPILHSGQLYRVFLCVYVCGATEYVQVQH